MTAEYIRQARKADKELQAQEDRFVGMEKRVEELEYQNNKHSAELKSLNRLVYAMQTSLQTAQNQKTAS
jgi:predicted  nucleic acid-binding Zn-ribbon protein